MMREMAKLLIQGWYVEYSNLLLNCSCPTSLSCENPSGYRHEQTGWLRQQSSTWATGEIARVWSSCTCRAPKCVWISHRIFSRDTSCHSNWYCQRERAVVCNSPYRFSSGLPHSVFGQYWCYALGLLGGCDRQFVFHYGSMFGELINEHQTVFKNYVLCSLAE